MPRRGENIYLRKDGRWEGRYPKGRKADGKIKYGYIYGRQYQDVKKRLILIKANAYQFGNNHKIIGNGSVYDWTEYWLENIVHPFVKPGTYAGYRRNITKHIYPYLRAVNIWDVTREQIQNLVNTLQKELASSTLHGICRLLKSILHSAVTHGVISSNPYFGIRLPKMIKREPRVMSKKEQQKFERKISETGNLEYYICLYTGLRVGEVCALKWTDIDLDNHVLHVRRSVQRIPADDKKKTFLTISTPKSEYSVRDIPMPAFLSSLLNQTKDKTKPSFDSFLFPGEKNRCRDPRTMQMQLKSLCRSLGLEGIHMHTLRHTFAARCLECNIRYEVLSELLGHSSPQITLRHYAHCTQERKRECMYRLHRIA